MRRILILPVAVVALGAAALVAREARSAPEAATYAGDTVHSFVNFKIKHLGTSWVYGRFDDFTVSVDVEGPDIKSVSFDVKTASVDTGTANRDTHLKGPDFFNAKQFPDVVFKSTSVKSGGKDGWDVTGDLTLHGVTKPITVRIFKVGSGKGMKGEELIGFETSFDVKRSEYDMGNMVGPVGDDVSLTVAVEAAKK